MRQLNQASDFPAFCRISTELCNKKPCAPVYINEGSGRREGRPEQLRKGQEMWKKIAADIKAAVILIAAEDINALRTLVKNIANLTSKSV